MSEYVKIGCQTILVVMLVTGSFTTLNSTTVLNDSSLRGRQVGLCAWCVVMSLSWAVLWCSGAMSTFGGWE